MSSKAILNLVRPTLYYSKITGNNTKLSALKDKFDKNYLLV